MLYMIIERFKNRDRESGLSPRFARRAHRLRTPRLCGKLGWRQTLIAACQLMECGDVRLLEQWATAGGSRRL